MKQCEVMSYKFGGPAYLCTEWISVFFFFGGGTTCKEHSLYILKRLLKWSELPASGNDGVT